MPVMGVILRGERPMNPNAADGFTLTQVASEGKDDGFENKSEGRASSHPSFPPRRSRHARRPVAFPLAVRKKRFLIPNAFPGEGISFAREAGRNERRKGSGKLKNVW
jgi:hypothetical protein